MPSFGIVGAAFAAFLLCAVPAQSCGLLVPCKTTMARVAKKAKLRPHVSRVRLLESRVEAMERRLSQDEVIVRGWIKSTAAAHSRLDAIPGK